MSEQQEILKWGDIIRIHGISTIKDKQTKGLIVSKGFTDPNVYYQNYKQFEEVNFYRESLFQILPKSNFDLHDQLLFDQNLSFQEKDSLKERAKEEVKILEEALESKSGQGITYEGEVIFKHIESGEYLSGVMKAADIGEGAFKLEMASDVSSFIIFKIKSHRSYENEGNIIYFNDCLQIYHVKSDCYMNFPNTDIPIIYDKEYTVASFQAENAAYPYFINRPSIKKPINTRINVINQNKSKCLWKFIEHCSHKVFQQKDKIKSHDIVYFKHTKNKGLIASTLAQQKYYLKELKENSEHQESSYECFWELIPKQVNENGPENCKFFWARNIVTGQLLTYNGYNVQIESKDIVEGGGFNSEGLVNLICSEKHELLERGNIKASDDELHKIIKYFEEKIKKYDLKSVERLTEDSFMIVRVPEETIKDVAYVLSSQEIFVKVVEILTTEMKSKDHSEFTFQGMFMSLNQDLLEMFISVLRLLSGKIYGTAFEEIQSSGNSPILQIQKILVETGIAQLLIELIYTLYEPFKFIEKNNEISEDRSRRFKITEIFELSYKLIEKLVKDFMENRIYLSRWVDLFLEHSNNINKSYIQECLVSILQNNPVSIEATIDQDKINTLIKCFLKEANNLQEGQFLTTKYLRLFSTFIRCDNRVLKENQHIILSDFFNNENNDLNIKFKVEYKVSEAEETDDPRDKEKNKIVKVFFGKDDPCSLPEFYDQNKYKFNYLVSYVNLLADVCMDRNNQAIEFVETVLPLAVVSTILIDPEIVSLNSTLRQENDEAKQKNEPYIFPNANIHEPFVRIGHHAYINNLKFSPIRRIRKIVNWYKTEEEIEASLNEDITKSKRVYEGEKEEEEKNYLQYLLVYIQNFLKSCDKHPSNLQILYTVLNFLKETIILGGWETIDEFRKIIPLLVKNIIKIENGIFFDADKDTKYRYSAYEYVGFNKEKLKMNRPEIALTIDCEIKAAEIFKYMNEMEIDIRLRYMMNFFQGIYEASQNFEIYNLDIENSVQPSFDDLSEEEKTITQIRNSHAKTEFYKIIGTNILGADVKKISEDQDIMLRQNIWYHKIKKMIPLEAVMTEEADSNRDLFKDSSEYPLGTIVLSLFELSGYQNRNLLNSSLNMLRAIFEQRRDLIQNVKSLLICGKGNLNEVYLTLKFMRNKFAMLQNDIITKYDGNPNKSFPYAIFKPYDHLGREEEKRAGIIQDLFFLSRTLKDNVSLKNIQSLMHVEKEVFDKKIVYHFYNERERNNELFQELNMAQQIYIPLLEYIKIVGKNELSEIHRWLLFSIYQYLTLLSFNNMKAKHIFMKHIAYIIPHLSKRVGAASFLYEVCNNNKILVNNEQLVNTIVDGCLQICVELEQEELIHGIISQSLPNSNFQNLLINNDYEKSRILSCLRGIMIFNDEGHKRNQELLMNKLQDNKYRRLIFNGDFVNFQSKKEDFNLDPPETYATNHFQLFSALVQSENPINIGKLENMHPYSYCLKCLSTTNRWQLRRALRSYVNRLYYVHKDKDIFLFEEFIRKEFTIINNELKDLIQLHKSKMLTDELKIRNGIRFVYAQSEIVLLILEILITLHEMFLKPEFIRLLKKELIKEQKLDDVKRTNHNHLVKILKNLGSIGILYPNTKIIFSFIKEIKKLMIKVMETFQVRYLEKKSEPEKQGIKQEEEIEQPQDKVEVSSKKNFKYDHSKTFFRNLVEMIKELKNKEKHEKLKEESSKRKNQMDISENDLKQKYLEVIFSVPGNNLKPINGVKVKELEEQHYKPHLQTANSKIFKVLAKPDLEENEENSELNNRLNAIKALLSDSPVFLKLKEDEFYKLVTIFTNLDNSSSAVYEEEWSRLKEISIPVYSRKEIITNCFNLIINNPEHISDDQKMFIIKLVRCYISEAVEEKQNYKLSVEKWNSDYYTDDQSSAEIGSPDATELVKRQHQIEECGGSRFLMSIFKENLFEKPQLLNEALLLGIVYLFNGNTHCQNSILSELKTDFSNSSLTSIKNLIVNLGKFLIEVRKVKENQKKRAFSYKIVDSYDYFDVKEGMLVKQFGHKSDKFEVQTEISYEQALCRIFRFLQLFCENNNIDMKNFLLSQTNSDKEQTTKPNSINFISEACLLLRMFFKIMSNKTVSIPPSLLDFINEITQIPCLANQIALLKSTFFEDVSYMADFFESKENIEQRKFNFFVDEETSSDDPLNSLQQIYQKVINLAISNFEGNDITIYWEFLNKCQPKFLWIVIKQNFLKIIRGKIATEMKISKEDIERELLENDKNKEIPQKFKEFFVEQAFLKKLFSMFDDRMLRKLIKSEQQKSGTYRAEIVNIITVISLIKKIEDYADEREKFAFKDKENIVLEESDKAFKAKSFRVEFIDFASKEYPHIISFLSRFEELVLSVEIASDNGAEISKQNLYFPNHPVFDLLALGTRDDIMFKVGRDTRRDKLITLFEYYQELKEEIEWNYQLKNYNFTILRKPASLSITSDLISEIRKYARWLSYLIVFLMCWTIFIDQDTIEQASYFTFSNYKNKMIMRILCLMQLSLTLIFFFLWITMRLKLCKQKYKREFGEEAEAEESQEDQSPVEEELAQPNNRIEQVRFYAAKIVKVFDNALVIPVKSVTFVREEGYDRLKSKFGFRHLRMLLSYLYDPIHKLVSDILISIYSLYLYESGFLSILIFVFASIYANLYGIQWYTIHMFDYFVGISLLTNVFKAIIDNIRQLTLLSVFAGCFILVFNVISLDTYTPVIYQDDLPAQSCEDIVGCVLQLYTSGAIGDDMDQFYLGRFVFDIAYVVFMEMLFQNLVSGIMIDAFGSLREADQTRDQDKSNLCYICGMAKAEMQKEGTIFKKHIGRHWLWNYLFYQYCLQLKDSSDFSGLEYFISNQISQENVDWFPDNGEKDQSGEIEVAFGFMKEKIYGFNSKTAEISNKNSEQIKSVSSTIQCAGSKKKEMEQAAILADQPVEIQIIE